ncbi:hypothetical protein JK191_05285 [Gluconobacter sphaericus]|uniref:hypothetical protein n=1 Tax=Gluconobacter sphaericus TaxID=574987 RepID=UPI001B8AD52E|nr:hypothetical protein [Gluconobacter sphaericus]MBS1096995.1 hypothetical protein [Gluconobacter sphaericus]
MPWVKTEYGERYDFTAKELVILDNAGYVFEDPEGWANDPDGAEAVLMKAIPIYYRLRGKSIGDLTVRGATFFSAIKDYLADIVPHQYRLPGPIPTEEENKAMARAAKTVRSLPQPRGATQDSFRPVAR